MCLSGVWGYKRREGRGRKLQFFDRSTAAKFRCTRLSVLTISMLPLNFKWGIVSFNFVFLEENFPTRRTFSERLNLGGVELPPFLPQLRRHWLCSLLYNRSATNQSKWSLALRRHVVCIVCTLWGIKTQQKFVVITSTILDRFWQRLICSVLDKSTTMYDIIFQLHLNNVATLPCKNLK